MNRILAIALLVFTITGTSFAQKIIEIDGHKDHVPRTLFKKEIRDGLYGSFGMGYSPINGENGIIANTRGGIIKDHWFAFGYFGTGFINNQENFEKMVKGFSDLNEYSLAGAYGGFFIEPILFPLKPVHLSFPIQFGLGAVGAFNDFTDAHFEENAAFFYVIEPGIELEVNFTRWMRIALFANYRHTPEIFMNNESVAKDALRGYSTGVNVKIGLF